MNIHQRPQSILGLVVRLVRVRGFGKKIIIGLTALVAIGMAVPVVISEGCPLHPLRVATFNIEDFPRSDQQVTGAFEAIAELETPVIAVQEITNPARFAKAARERLGESWQFVYNRRGPRHRLGVLFDGDRFELVETRQHDGTTLGEGHKPTLEVVLDPKDGDRRVHVVVVHLKAGGDSAPIRRRQLEALEQILERILGSDDRVVVLGDFNATGPEDRGAIAELAERTEMVWLTDSLECTSYWDRSDGCRGVALDHVLIDAIPLGASARGPCETEGCETRESCPIFHRDVSDHCPVVAEMF